MATLVAANPKVVAGPDMETVSMLVKNGESWSAGEFLNVDANGLLNECASDDDAGAGGIKYYALADMSDPGNSTTYEEVGVIHSDHVFEGNELNGAVTGANIGNHYAIDVTTNVVTVDVDDTGNDAVIITDIGPNWNPAEYVLADTLAKVRFKILTVCLEAANA